MRIVGFDIARALAIYGMVLVNFKVVMQAGERGPEWLVWLASLLEGRAAATFVVLAGVGVTLGSRTALRSGDAGALRRQRISLWKRSLLLLAIGFAYLPIWPADILQFYAFYLALGALALAWPDRRLLWAATLLSLLFVSLLFVFDYESGWDWSTLTYYSMWTPDSMLRRLFFNGFHPVIPWTGFLWVGMWLGRQDLRDAEVRKRLLLCAATIGLSVELASRWLVARALTGAAAGDVETVRALLGTTMMPPMPQYLLAGVCTALVVIVLCVALAESLPSGILRPLVSTGQLALSLYVAHVVIGMGALEALGALEGRSLPFSIAYGTAFFALSILFATLWQRRFERGPLETVMRRISG